MVNFRKAASQPAQVEGIELKSANISVLSMEVQKKSWSHQS